jgi:hypothetical protein
MIGADGGACKQQLTTAFKDGVEAAQPGLQSELDAADLEQEQRGLRPA